MNALKTVVRVFKKIGVAGYSRKKNVLGMNPLIISTIFIILTAVLAKVTRRVIQPATQGFVKQLLLEFVATAELCACCFELAVIADNYGVWTYALYLFLLTVLWMHTWENASACPYSPMEEVMEGTTNIKNAVLIIISQIIGGAVIFQYVQAIWSLELAEIHEGKADEECSADLQVPMLTGAAVEGVATCLCRLASRFLNDTEARFASYVDAFFATMMVVAAFNFSGGYFNPALATSLKWGCDGQTMGEFMVVYWLGACIGSLASVYIYNSRPVKSLLERIKPKKE